MKQSYDSLFSRHSFWWILCIEWSQTKQLNVHKVFGKSDFISLMILSADKAVKKLELEKMLLKILQFLPDLEVMQKEGIPKIPGFIK